MKISRVKDLSIKSYGKKLENNQMHGAPWKVKLAVLHIYSPLGELALVYWKGQAEENPTLAEWS